MKAKTQVRDILFSARDQSTIQVREIAKEIKALSKDLAKLTVKAIHKFKAERSQNVFNKLKRSKVI